MKRRNVIGMALAMTGLGLLTACGGGGSGGGGGSAAYNAANTSVVNASNATGGTLSYGMTNTPDSIDPGNTYYAFMWNFSRLYASPLLTYNPAPGPDGLKLVPDLATGLGQVSDNGLTWTYHIRSGMKLSDGEPITTAQIKYAVERGNFAKDILPNGPSYFAQYLAGGSAYQGPYKDKSPGGLASIETPDDTTIVFHLAQPFADFDYLVTSPQTAPVPQAKDTGANYQTDPVASGPYMIQPGSFKPDTGVTLVKNPNWKQSDSPTVKQTVDRIDLTFNISGDDLDNRLLNGSLDVDAYGTGMQTAGRAKVLNNATQKKNADAAPSGFEWYFPINTQVIPNVDCRRAIEYAADKTLFQNAYGGPEAGGDIASTVLPPSVVGYQKFDLYEATTQPGGDLAKAKDELAKCGQPNGFSFNVAVRGDRPKEVATAQALQQSLAKIGVKTDILQYPTGDYGTSYAGSPQFMKDHNIGMASYGWAADWPEGFGYLSQIADGRAIRSAGNSNMEMLNDPQVNQLLDQAAAATDAGTRNGFYAQIDRIMMDQAVILPELYARSLLYRGPNLTNVFVTEAYGMYDYTQLGKKSS
ncbi:peptide/nickel transport system substrate-binding protein [Amycolatopsis bartoniae]|uniref:Peptide ABC transporter substrate-binding protein n=1 Tax=Amycolatopsis bartoniae TaxID=941986 RepID=A0A8H9IMV8_9PSEU|nr:ABC transporter substrate-binding protein [Amycolatopsis bartoniae]MBB2938199.1 peptide/nickel transport system substrate-binding protein [Amycolatopsis bartoniae]TVT08984.1 ABC transporter substrate-binding protein [Amycolatopsis bartoniae]GHF33394.1 peptide ABC transporter substrate-binding protein [Amycolatopsis bartoniae]